MTIKTHVNPLREQAYRVPPPRFHEGIPSTPKHLLTGTTYIAIDDARFYEIKKLPGGVIQLGVRSDSGVQARILKRPGEPELDEPIRIEGVDFRFLVRSASTLLSMLGREFTIDDSRLVDAPSDEVRANAETWIDCGECPSLTVSTQGNDQSCWLFLRSLEKPYALRLHLTLEDVRLMSAKMTACIADMTYEDWTAHVEKIDMKYYVGKFPEETGPKQYDGPKTIDDKPAESAEAAPAQAAPSPSPSPIPSAPPHELAARKIFGAAANLAKNIGSGILKRIFG